VKGDSRMLAYIDPGSGSFVLQAIVAGLAGVIVAVNAYWTRIKRFFGASGEKEDAETSTSAKPTDD